MIRIRGSFFFAYIPEGGCSIVVKLVCFLGNPGPGYAGTRHNAGAAAGDLWAAGRGMAWQKKFKGLFFSERVSGETRGFLKPLTFMNRSGESAAACAGYFGIRPEEILAVHDDIEMEFGSAGVKKGGGLGGHNGLKSLERHLSSRDFFRLRIGVSRPPYGDVASWVLSPFPKEQREEVNTVLAACGRLLDRLLTEDPAEMIRTHSKISILE